MDKRLNQAGILRLLCCFLLVIIIVALDIQCFYLKYLQVPCLGCGMTRAWKALLLGRLMQAYEFHHAFWTIPIFLTYIYKGKFLFKRHLLDLSIIIVLLVFFIENYIRNL